MIRFKHQPTPKRDAEDQASPWPFVFAAALVVILALGGGL